MTRRIRAALLSPLLAIAATWPAMARAGAKCGDLHGDGLLGIGDALLLLQTVANPPGEPSLCGGMGALQCGDTNGDGTLTIADVVIFLNYLAGNPTLFPICTGPGPTIACPGPAGVSRHAATDGNLQWTGQATRSGSITASEVWPSGCRVNLDGFVFVQSGVTLTIQPGAIVVGQGPDRSTISALVVLQGAKIVAAGTPVRPIVMTSSAHPRHGRGRPRRGLGWPHDQRQRTGQLPRWGMPRRGAGGGAVRRERGNDLFDMQLATQSRVQYGLGVYYEPFLQNLGNESIEWDNNENGFDLLPRSAPILCNVTTIGTNLQPSVGLGTTERAATLRRGTSGHISNWIGMHFRSAGLNLADNATANQACDPGPVLKPDGLLVDHSLFFDNGTDTTGGPHFGNVRSNWSKTGPAGSPFANCTGAEYWNLITAGGTISPTAINAAGDPSDPGEGLDPGIVVKYGLGLSDSQTDLGQFVPTDTAAPGFPLVTALAGDCHTLDPFFDATGYIGAFDPTKPSWLTAPWVSFELE